MQHPQTDDPVHPGLARIAADVAKLDRMMSCCHACPRLVAWREQVGAVRRAEFRDETYWARAVPGFGDPAAAVLVVGLAAAAHGANRTGRMFTGDRSGDFLVAAMHRTGFASQPTSTHRDDGLRPTGARLTAPAHCAPPDNTPTPAERRACAPFLRRELELLRPRVAVVLGGFGWQAMLTTLAELGWAVPRPWLPRPVTAPRLEAPRLRRGAGASAHGSPATAPRWPRGRGRRAEPLRRA